MSNRPQTLDDWSAYVRNLSGKRLFSQVVNANTQGFARELVDEGTMTMADVEKLMLIFVRQLRATGTKVPSGGGFNLVNMALTDPIARKGPTMSEEEADLPESMYEAPPVDDLDSFLMSAAFED